MRSRDVDGVEEGYGYGWQVREFLGDTLVGHGGSIGVSTAYVGCLVDAGVGVALLRNVAADPHPMQVGPAVLAIARGGDETAVPRFALDRKYDPLTGAYEAFRGTGTATVERAGGTLSMEFGTGTATCELTLVPESLDPDDGRFAVVTEAGKRTPATFEETDDGYDLFFERWRLHATD